MNKVSHFEIPADDTQRVSSFYSEVFGWKLMPMPDMKYTIVHTGPTDDKGMNKEPGFINGGIMERGDKVPHPTVVLEVESVDNMLKKVTNNGGKIVMGKTTVGDMGYVAYFKDTEGNVIGMWESQEK